METIEEKIDRMLMLAGRSAIYGVKAIGHPDRARLETQAKRWATQRDKLKREILDYIEQLEREVEGGRGQEDHDSVCQGPYERAVRRLRPLLYVRGDEGGISGGGGKRVVIKRPGQVPKTYENPGLDIFVALTDLIRRYSLPIYPWGTSLGYTAYWPPEKREVESEGS